MLEIYTDGAASGDPGPSGIGIYIKNGKDHVEYSFYSGVYSNHEAEFLAVIKALEICKQAYPEEILSVRSDSKLVVDVIEKEFTKNPKFAPLLDEILRKSHTFPYFFIKWIPEKQNSKADQLARQAIQRHKEDFFTQ
ncbi:ribonuclease HI family protein [Radiobacillus deserti]|uniref:Ribonuclease HI family protein n=1 Tax=Radiobacillus deserti TaxID=2594883 RepID=A0A516KG82_9BACI|nr:ribonuclease HI family protein [Radiobacillus deserti]QDP40413.1 ribonuclease HI family protein [Radiobacillus deserti]